MNARANVKTVALRWGLIFGILAGALINIMTLLTYLTPAMASVSNVTAIAVFGICLILCGYAGYQAVRKTGRVTSGLQSGLYARIVSGLMSSPVSLFLNYVNSEVVRQQILWVTLVFGCTLGIYVILALAAGAIGGKIGQRGLVSEK